ncbi:MAG TPA: GNAT family N-acetyltransferase [Acidimicrobiales bacterium]|nr:GNAT family N-acetyltransferase [Acidimicrobiales bacterium]
MSGASEKAVALLRQLDLSIYTSADRDEVLAFKCAPIGHRPAEAAQDLIYKATDRLGDFGSGYPYFVLARDNGVLVGAIIFGLEHPDDPAIQIFTLGVAVTRHREGIGTMLKKIAMALAVSDEAFPNAVASTVHRANYRMNGLNDNLGIGRNQDPLDGEFYITGATVELVNGPEIVRVTDRPPED